MQQNSQYAINFLPKQFSKMKSNKNFTFFYSQLLTRKNLQYQKMRLTSYDKLYYYYYTNFAMPLFMLKAFTILEIQVNIVIIRSKLVPYFFMIEQLCFYRLIYINSIAVNNSCAVIKRYDLLSVPHDFYLRITYRQYQYLHMPKYFYKFFKLYWSHFTSFSFNKIWLLNHCITSTIIAHTIIFDYPHINIYIHPFKRFTQTYLRNQPYAAMPQRKKTVGFVLNSFDLIRLQIFEYFNFYK